MKIKVLITGGTIEDLDYEKPEDAPEHHKSFIHDLLKQGRVTVDTDVEEILFKDSRHVTDKDREVILNKCKESGEDKIIITHGTMTMPLTAKFLGEKHLQKTIVLFGSAIPANKDKSDALLNLGTALCAVQFLPKGVYVTMNGKIFSWENVKKNLDTGYFEKES